MNTSYYLEKHCECCGHTRELHLGRSAGGWLFMARYYHGIGTYEAFASFVREKVENGFAVKDEYGTQHNAEEFLSGIPKRKGDKCHACEYPRNYWGDKQVHDHEHGISFHDYEFS